MDSGSVESIRSHSRTRVWWQPGVGHQCLGVCGMQRKGCSHLGPDPSCTSRAGTGTQSACSPLLSARLSVGTSHLPRVHIKRHHCDAAQPRTRRRAHPRRRIIIKSRKVSDKRKRFLKKWEGARLSSIIKVSQIHVHAYFLGFSVGEILDLVVSSWRKWLHPFGVQED